MADDLTLGEAAKAIGVSADTLRRWDTHRQAPHVRDANNRRRVPAAEVERLSEHPRRHDTGDTLSARNRFPGVVRSVEVDGVMALVEIEAGPFLVTAAVTRDSVEELGLAPGVKATAAVKATSVMVSAMRRGAALLAALAVLAGCGGDDEPLKVSAAASLKKALTAYDERTPASRSRAPTSSPRRSARAPSPTCSPPPTPSSPTSCTRTGWSRSPSRSRATGSCSPSRPTATPRSASLRDLERKGVTLAIGSESVPVGSYTRDVLEPAARARGVGDPAQRPLRGARRGGHRRQAHPGRRRRRASSTSPTCAAPAGELRAIELPDALQPSVAYGVAVVKGTEHAEDAQAFVDGLLEGDGQSALEAAGFEPPPPQ